MSLETINQVERGGLHNLQPHARTPKRWLQCRQYCKTWCDKYKQ